MVGVAGYYSLVEGFNGCGCRLLFSWWRDLMVRVVDYYSPGGEI